MCMQTAGEARLCINSHCRCSVSFQTSRISSDLLQQIHKLLFNKQYQRVKLGCCPSATGRPPASIANFPLYLTICLRGTQGASAAAQRCGLRNPFIALCCSAQNLVGRASEQVRDGIGDISELSPMALLAEEETGTERLEEAIQRQQK